MSDNINVNYSLTQDWGDGFEGKITIANNSDSNLVSWDLDFDLDSQITGVWDAQIAENNNGSYTLKHQPWNREIKAGESLTFNFVADGNDTKAENFDIEGSTFNSPSSQDSIYSYSNPNLDSELSLGEEYQGRATFYDAANPTGGKGNSGYDVPVGDDLAGVAAINNIQWNGSEASGGFLRVSGPKQREGAAPIIVQVSDLLYERADGLDLSAEAFAKVADPSDGVVNIEYELIDPGDNFKTPYYDYTLGQGIVAEGITGTNPWYAAVRLNNHRYPVKSVEILNEDGGTTEMNRGDDNRFYLDTNGMYGAQDLQVTDIFGQQVVLDDIDITSGSEVDVLTGTQFASL